MRRTLYITVSMLIIFVFSLCRKDKGKVGFGNYPSDVGKIMVYKCATSGCHNNLSYLASGGLNLTTWNDMFKGTNSGSSVIPFRADFSSLCYFVNTYTDLGIINSPTMPFNGSALSRQEVECIRNWINDGAPDVNGNIKWADNPLRKKIYVVNQGCDVVTVFDSETQLPIRYITVGNNAGIEIPHVVKVSPDGQFWYVVFVNNNIMQKFRCSDDALVGEAVLGANLDWNTFTITDDGKKAFCVAWTSNGHVASVDLVNMKLITNLPGLTYPHGVALNAANDSIYVTGQSGNFIYALDTALSMKNQIVLNGAPLTYSSSLDPHEIMLSPDKTQFYLTCEKSNEIRVLNIASYAVTTIPNIYNAKEMALSTSKNKLFITCMDDTTSFVGQHGCVVMMDVNFPYNIQKIKVGYMPHGIGVDESKKLIYVASRNIYSNGPAPHHTSVCNGRNGFVNYIDLNTLQVLTKRTEVSVDPYSVAVRK